MIRPAIAIFALCAMAACGAPVTQASLAGSSPLAPSLRDLAAPYQDLDQVTLQADDNCYWYLHRGPVETTLLPLRDRTGRVICASAS